VLTVQIIDNSGGLLAECINVLRFKSSKGLGRVGTWGALGGQGRG